MSIYLIIKAFKSRIAKQNKTIIIFISSSSSNELSYNFFDLPIIPLIIIIFWKSLLLYNNFCVFHTRKRYTKNNETSTLLIWKIMTFIILSFSNYDKNCPFFSFTLVSIVFTSIFRFFRISSFYIYFFLKAFILIP